MRSRVFAKLGVSNLYVVGSKTFAKIWSNTPKQTRAFVQILSNKAVRTRNLSTP